MLPELEPGSELEKRLKALQAKFEFSLDDLRYKWEAWSLTHADADGQLSKFEDNLAEFETYIVGQQKRHTKFLIRKHPVNNESLLDFGESKANDAKTNNNFAVVHETLMSETTPAPPLPLYNMNSILYRTMYQMQNQVSDELNAQIERVMDLVADALSVPIDDICNPSMVTQQDVLVVGRIVPEPPNMDIMPMGIMIEACRKRGGTRTRLDYSNLASYSFFSGQVVVLKGSNPTGNVFVAKKLMEIPKLTLSKNDSLPVFDVTQDGVLIVAAGPYTPTTDLEYEPLECFVDKVVSAPPSAVLLLGPFVDDTHPQIRSGSLPDSLKNSTLEQIFHSKVMPLLRRITEVTPLMLVPSLHDVNSSHLAFPQAQLNVDCAGTKSSLYCLPNPGFFNISKFSVAVASVPTIDDLLRTISRFEIGKVVPATTLAFEHVLQQRRLYPRYPSTTVSLDVPHLSLASLNDAPHILVLPSIHNTVKKVNETLCISPGRIVRNDKAGSFARIVLPTMQSLDMTSGSIVSLN